MTNTAPVPAAHALSWQRNGTPRRVGRYTQWVGTTQARAVCSCGWHGSTFPTHNVEFFTVVGEREHAAHVSSVASH